MCFYYIFNIKKVSFHQLSLFSYNFTSIHPSAHPLIFCCLGCGGRSLSKMPRPSSSQPPPPSFLGNTEAFLSQHRDVILQCVLGLPQNTYTGRSSVGVYIKWPNWLLSMWSASSSTSSPSACLWQEQTYGGSSCPPLIPIIIIIIILLVSI